jgi:glycosyltransferase involved in cell wall biosynthesis
MDGARICVVGAGTRFLSGISVYTMRLANALAVRHDVSVVTMRQLIPGRLYPGHRRIGQNLTVLARHPQVRLFDGVDWYWLPTLFKAIRFVSRQRPQFVIMQWWSGSVLHSYVALGVLARLLGARLILEFHELLDTGEARIPLARLYVGSVQPLLLRLADAYTVHSAFDRALLARHHHIEGTPIVILPHGPHDHYQVAGDRDERLLREAPTSVCNLLYFGVIRPYKGVEDLLAAFEAIPETEIGRYWLTIVGETWEGWTLPAEMVARSPYRQRITFDNRYVPDADLHAYLLGADAVVLPYRRSSLSGPLHVAMGYGLPIVMSDVGGNPEAAQGYGGLTIFPAGDQEALVKALRTLPSRRGARYSHPHSWEDTAAGYDELFAQLERSGGRPLGTAR